VATTAAATTVAGITMVVDITTAGGITTVGVTATAADIITARTITIITITAISGPARPWEDCSDMPSAIRETHAPVRSTAWIIPACAIKISTRDGRSGQNETGTGRAIGSEGS
jgi:hypothetical protein